MKSDQLQFCSFQWSFFPEELEGDFLLNPLDDCLSTTTVAKGTRLYLGTIFPGLVKSVSQRSSWDYFAVVNFNIVLFFLHFPFYLWTQLRKHPWTLQSVVSVIICGISKRPCCPTTRFGDDEVTSMPSVGSSHGHLRCQDLQRLSETATDLGSQKMAGEYGRA